MEWFRSENMFFWRVLYLLMCTKDERVFFDQFFFDKFHEPALFRVKAATKKTI